MFYLGLNPLLLKNREKQVCKLICKLFLAISRIAQPIFTLCTTWPAALPIQDRAGMNNLYDQNALHTPTT
jgi:hypothetical protein